MHSFINHVSCVIHLISTPIHNLEKFFAFFWRKYTLTVYKDLLVNILLSKKENINRKPAKPDAICHRLPLFWEAQLVLFQAQAQHRDGRCLDYDLLAAGPDSEQDLPDEG